jgi:hypothetical protein
LQSLRASAWSLLIALANLYWGLILFTILTFVAQVPTFAGALSIVKIAGLVLLVAWLGVLTTQRDEHSDFFSAHPTVAILIVLFLSWIGLGATWSPDSAQSLLSRFS